MEPKSHSDITAEWKKCVQIFPMEALSSNLNKNKSYQRTGQKAWVQHFLYFTLKEYIAMFIIFLFLLRFCLLSPPNRFWNNSRQLTWAVFKFYF